MRRRPAKAAVRETAPTPAEGRVKVLTAGKWQAASIAAGGQRPLAVSPEARALDKDIWAMAWPTMLSLIVVNLVDIVDVALVGRLGRQTVAAWG